VRAWEERIQREFRPVAWEETADCLLQLLDEQPVAVAA
jgi:hypothetical protein